MPKKSTLKNLPPVIFVDLKRHTARTSETSLSGQPDISLPPLYYHLLIQCASLKPGTKITDIDLRANSWHEPPCDKITTRKYKTGVQALHKDVTAKLGLPPVLKVFLGVHKETGKRYRRTHVGIEIVNVPDPIKKAIKRDIRRRKEDRELDTEITEGARIHENMERWSSVVEVNVTALIKDPPLPARKKGKGGVNSHDVTEAAFIAVYEAVVVQAKLLNKKHTQQTILDLIADEMLTTEQVSFNHDDWETLCKNLFRKIKSRYPKLADDPLWVLDDFCEALSIWEPAGMDEPQKGKAVLRYDPKDFQMTL